MDANYNTNFSTPVMRGALQAGLLLILNAALAVPCAAGFITDTLGSAGPSNWAIFVGPGTIDLALVGPGTTTGNVGCAVCVAQLNASNSAPIPNIAIEGDLYLGNSASVINGAQVSGTIHTGQNLTQDWTDALNASSTFAGLAPTLSVPGGAINGTTTINGTAGVNVVNISGLNLGNGQTLTLNGPAGSQFVINDSGAITLNSGRINLTGGLTIDDVVFNETGSSGLLSTSGGLNNLAVINGIVLAPDRSVAFAPGLINGELIAGGNPVHLVSGASVTSPAGPSVPEPSTYITLGAGLLGVTIVMYLKRPLLMRF